MPKNGFGKKRNLKHLFDKKNRSVLDPGTVKRKFPLEYYRHGKRFLDYFPPKVIQAKKVLFLLI